MNDPPAEGPPTEAEGPPAGGPPGDAAGSLARRHGEVERRAGDTSLAPVADHPLRRFPVAVSAGSMALAWARQEGAPQGSTVVVDYEVNPLDRLGEAWPVGPGLTLACAMVLRPHLAASAADVVWLAGGLAAIEGARAASGMDLATWWPDRVVDAATHHSVAQTKCEVQLGPGRVRSAVVTMRFDLASLGLPPEHSEHLLAAVRAAMDEVAGTLSSDPPRRLRLPVGVQSAEPLTKMLEAQQPIGAPDASPSPDAGDPDVAPATVPSGAAQIAEAYTQRCGLVGCRVRLALRPKGEARGFVRRVDELARIEVGSSTGMVERVSIDMLRSMQVS